MDENINKIVNEEVTKTTEEIATASSGKGFKVAAGVGLTVLGGFVAYKYIIKPIMAKIKAKHGETIELKDDEYEFEEIDEKTE